MTIQLKVEALIAISDASRMPIDAVPNLTLEQWPGVRADVRNARQDADADAAIVAAQHDRDACDEAIVTIQQHIADTI